jgi:hypothetical protein
MSQFVNSRAKNRPPQGTPDVDFLDAAGSVLRNARAVACHFQTCAESPGPPPVSDRRAHPRRPCCRAVAYESAGHSEWLAAIVEASAGGVCVVLSGGTPPGSPVTLTPDALGRPLGGRVVWSRGFGTTSWLAGCAFDKPLTAEELARLA